MPVGSKAFAFSLLLLATCSGPPIRVGNYSMDKESFERDSAEVKQRASFEMNCPAAQLEVSVLATTGDATDTNNQAKQLGVSGCGRRLVYVLTYSGWLLNGSSEPGPKP